ncbi:MAG: type II and III secretion system protein family protein [Alphaproteobacteria bacterium]|nr:type II and III secretion system protein family protein [Alphaproteobacteria bacterium]
MPKGRIVRAGLLALVLAAFCATPAAAQTIDYDIATTSAMRISLPASQALTVLMSEEIGKVVPADARIADAQMITTKSIFLVGRAFGTTTVNIFDADGKPVGLLSVEVGADVNDMAVSIRQAVPSSSVRVDSVNGRVKLSGTVPDQSSMDKVLDIAGQYGGPSVINTMTLSGGRQVNLEVRILEAQRAAGRQLGIQWAGNVGGVSTDVARRVGGPAEGATTFSAFITDIIADGIGINLSTMINALETKNLVRTLAEPNLTTLSGVDASFLAGGEIPVRFLDPDGNVVLDYHEFGVKLSFTPVVLDDDRIQIHLEPEVSGINGYTEAGDPIFNSRTLEATVELRDGQSFAVAGLLQNGTTLSQDQLPWLGDVPILGALFKSSEYQKNDTELVVIVTPRLVQPSAPGEYVASPLDGTLPANDVQFFLLGQLEVTPKMIHDFKAGSGVIGPYGYIIDLGTEPSP